MVGLGIIGQRRGLPGLIGVGHRFIVDGVGRDEHERKVAGAQFRFDIFFGNGANLPLDGVLEIPPESLLFPGILGGQIALVVVPGELGIDGDDNIADDDRRIDPLLPADAVLALPDTLGQGSLE